MSRVATPLAVETPPETPLEDSAANDECVVVSLKRERSLEREKETRKRRRIVTDRDTDSSPHARPPSRLGVAVVESVEVDVEISEPHAERAPSPTESPERASTPASSSPTVTVTATTDATPPRTATPTPTPPPRASTPTSTMPTSTLSASTPTSSTPPARSATRTPTSLSPQPPRASTPTASTPRSTYRQRASDMRLTIRPPIMIPGQESAARRSQITPPPSDRMLDHSNPPQPPRKVKKKRRLNSQYPGSGRRSTSPPVPLMVSPARVPIARLPRLSSESSSTRSGDASPLPSPASTSARSSLLMVAPPSRVFRSLEAEFDAVADEPPRPLRLHSPPALHRVTRMFPEPTSTTNSGPNGSAHSSPSVVRVKPRATRAPIVSISTASPSSTTTSAVAASVTKPEPVTGTAKTDNTVETTRQELSLKRKERPSDEDEA